MSEQDWKARAEREAAALIAGAVGTYRDYTYDHVLRLCAVAWLQGVDLGEHRTLSTVDDALDQLRAAL